MASPFDPSDNASAVGAALTDGPDFLPELVADRRRPADAADLPQEGSYAAAKIARRRRLQIIPWVLSALLLVVNILQPLVYMRALAARREVVLMDANSNLLVSPLLEPMRNDRVQEILFNWAAKGFFDRTPNGFANPILLESYFDPTAREQANADWQSQREQARAKEAFQEYSPFNFQIQAREGTRLRVRVDGQLKVTARDNGQLVVFPESRAIELTFRTNPDLGGNRFFPLVVERWRYLPDPLPIPGT